MRRFAPLLIGSFLFFSACGGEPESLRTIEIPLSGESVMGDIDGDEYRFFRYQTEEEAQKDAAKIRRDGKKIAGKKMYWEGPVHMYSFRARIVIYVGDNQQTLSVIEQVFGPQIAGDAVRE
jgi:hypothetical protein